MFRQIRKWISEKANQEASNLLKHKINDLMNNRNFVEAEKELQRLLTLQSDAETMNVLSKIMLHQGKLEEGIEMLQQAVSQEEKYAHGFIQFVDAFHSIEELKKAEELAIQTLQKHPHLFSLRLYLAQRLFENGQFKEAESELASVLSQDAENLDAQIGLAYCYIATNRKTEALAKVESIRKKHPKQADQLLSAIYENVQNFS